MKKLITCIVLGLLTISAFKLTASSITGGSITYKYAGNDSIDVTLTIYRDCNGISLSTPSVKLTTACATQSYALTFVSKRDITGVGLNCTVTSRCAGSYTYGFEESVFIGRIGLGSLNTSCCNYTLSWEQYGRNGAITTGAANQNFYIETNFNRCLAPGNSSPVIQSTPKILIPLGQNQSLNFYATDVDGDLLKYEFVEPLSASGTAISYSGSWSKERPITFLGFPHGSTSLPGGIRLDSSTGMLYFRPAKKDEATVMVMKVTEWRKIGGTYTKIGEMTRDIQEIVINYANNKAPALSVSDKTIKICGSTGTFCTDIKITDADSADTVSMVYKHQLKNITFNNIGTPSKPVIRVCYTPDSAEVASGKLLAFTIEAKDNACPLPASIEETFVFNIGTHMPDSFGMTKSLNCGTISLGFVNNSSTITGLTPVFEVTHNGIPVALDINNKITNITSAGWYYAKLTVQSSAYCDTRVYSDSILVPQSALFSVDAGSAQKICGPALPTLTAIVSGGASPYKYQWSTGAADSLASVTFTPTNLGEKYYLITVTDNNGCITKDSVQVGYYNPIITVTGTSQQCTGKAINLQATITNTVNPSYQWNGFVANQTNVTANANATTNYTFSLTDNGCVVTKQWLVTVYAPNLTFSHTTNFCDGNNVVLSSTPSGGLAPYNIFWNAFSQSGASVSAGVLAQGTYNHWVTLTDAFGCSVQKNNVFIVYPLPQLLVSLPSIVCESASPIDLKNYAIPQAGTWSGPGVSGNFFTPANSGSGVQTLSYSYTDNGTGCSATKTSSTLVDVQPVASFTVDSIKGPKGYSFKFTNTSKMGGLNYGVWNFGDPNSGANNIINFPNPTHTFSDTGKYTVKLSVSGGFCPPDSITKTNYIFVYAPTNVSVNELVNNNIRLYPNPAHNEVAIESGFEIKRLWLTDMLGREVYPAFTTNYYTSQVELATVAAGTYLLTVESQDGQRGSTKLIITR